MACRGISAGVVLLLLASTSPVHGQGERKIIREFSATASERLLEERDFREERGRISLSAGAEFSRGDFDDDVDTDILFVPLSLRYEGVRWLARITVPFISIDGPGDVVGGTQGPLLTGRRAEAARQTTRESGIGDVVASLTYVVNPDAERWPILEVTGKVKLPTADEDEGLGTGETDYTVQLDLAQSFGRVTPFAGIGYRWLGDPSDIDLDDSIVGSAGFSLRATERTQLGLAFDYREASTRNTEDARELVAFGSLRLSQRWKLSPYVVMGLSDATSDVAAGFTISFRVR